MPCPPDWKVAVTTKRRIDSCNMQLLALTRARSCKQAKAVLAILNVYALGLRDQFSDPGKCRDLITESSEMNAHSASGHSLDLSPIEGRLLMALNPMEQQLSMSSDRIIA